MAGVRRSFLPNERMHDSIAPFATPVAHDPWAVAFVAIPAIAIGLLLAGEVRGPYIAVPIGAAAFLVILWASHGDRLA